MSTLKPEIKHAIARVLGAREVVYLENIQPLWSGYGEIIRCGVSGAEVQTVIVKHVNVPREVFHPKGWNTNAAHQRKMLSYEVESNWYRHWARQAYCRIPRAYGLKASDNEFLLILEDLDAAGYARRIEKASIANMEVCLRWLAHFHATFIHCSPSDCAHPLWPTGSYWHLATRQSEWAALKDQEQDLSKALYCAAADIDSSLSNCQYQTLIHGDAKLANFCFSEDANTVAGVDFQYVGGGCGIKDVALFISSCLSSEQCEQHEQDLLDHYFDCLRAALIAKGSDVDAREIDAEEVEREWRALYPLAWADFVRFLMGWSPGHWKIHSYSKALTRAALEALSFD